MPLSDCELSGCDRLRHAPRPGTADLLVRSGEVGRALGARRRRLGLRLSDAYLAAGLCPTAAYAIEAGGHAWTRDLEAYRLALCRLRLARMAFARRKRERGAP